MHIWKVLNIGHISIMYK